MGGGTSWTQGNNWNPNGVPASGDTITMDNSIVQIPASMTISANMGALSITFSNNFNTTNTATIGSGSATAPVFTFDSGWSLTNNATSGTVTFQPTNGGSAPLSFKLNGSGTVTVASGATIAWNTVIADGIASAGITKSGLGTLSLGNINTFTGATLISTNGGTLRLAAAGALGGTSSVTVNSGGTLLLSGSNTINDRINNSAGVILAGGTFSLNGLSEGAAGTTGVGALTLTSNSTIDFAIGTFSSVIQFAAVGAHVPVTGPDLIITNWDGTTYFGGGPERLLFAGNASTFMTQYDQMDVYFNGVQGYHLTQYSGYFEVSMIPEPSTLVTAALALLAIGYLQRRRLHRVRIWNRGLRKV